jgi:hypothetical protein
MRIAAALCLSLGLSVAVPTAAHDTLPANWCPAGTFPTVVSHFELATATLIDYREQRLHDGTVLGSECNDPKSCGIVDDWHWANQAAVESCGIDQLRKSQPAQSPAEQAMPFVLYPESFNDDANHHDLYRFKSGLKGVCVVCRAPAIPDASDDADS